METLIVLRLKVDSDSLKQPGETDKDIQNKVQAMIADLTTAVLQYYYQDQIKLVEVALGRGYNIECN